ncbi:FMRFamide receptor-like isoform X2 [Artemia franciscana]|nr:hypothetical protein QYM36_000174 [Artemia franciscana]KAK2725583.1 hypothetical protein QYM36_000174 [Artemia franciscana]
MEDHLVSTPPISFSDYLVDSVTSETGISFDMDCEFALAFRDGSRFWIQRVLVPIVVAVGVLGNIVSMVILMSRGMRSSTNLYLTALATSDTLYLICIFILSLEHYPGTNDVSYRAYWHARPYCMWLTDASSNTSVWITVSFTIERYIAVCYPMRRQSLCTESRAKKVIFIVFFVAFLLSSSTSFEWIITETMDKVTNTTKIEMKFSPLGNDETYRQGYYWFTSLMFVFFPLLLLTIFNAYLINSVRKSGLLRRQMINEKSDEKSQNQETRITIILISVVIVFIVCQLPTALILIYTSSVNPSPNSYVSEMLRGLGNIFNFLMSINAACNFILYCALSDKYRKSFLKIFCRCLLKDREFSPQHTLVSSVAYNRRYSDDGHVEIAYKARKENIYRPPKNGALLITRVPESGVIGQGPLPSPKNFISRPTLNSSE